VGAESGRQEILSDLLQMTQRKPGRTQRDISLTAPHCWRRICSHAETRPCNRRCLSRRANLLRIPASPSVSSVDLLLSTRPGAGFFSEEFRVEWLDYCRVSEALATFVSGCVQEALLHLRLSSCGGFHGP
jgi:hypothetical protein